MSSIVHRFGEFEFELTSRRLFRGAVPVRLSDTKSAILACLITQAGEVVSKETLVAKAFGLQAVTDDNFLQQMSRLRKAVQSADGSIVIERIPFRGYRFVAPVHRAERHDDPARPEGDLGPYRAFVEGRARLHTLSSDGISRAQKAFEEALQKNPDYADAHIGLANACSLTFDATRFDEACDREALARAIRHAHRAVDLAPASGEAWSSLAFALCLQGHTLESAAAARKAIALEPDDWLHWLRLAFVSWGEDRIRAARTMLGLSPATALGHWLIATVLIARGAFDAALDVLRDGCAAQDEESARRGTFPAVGLYLLRGLVLAAQQRLDEAVDALNRELSGIDKGQMYARECIANTWYALGAIHLRRRQCDAAEDAFANALRVAPAHVFTLAALGRLPSAPSFTIHDSRFTIDLDRQLAGAIALARAGRHVEAAQTYRIAIDDGPPKGGRHDSAGWLLPVEPLIDPMSRRDVWGDVLAMVRRRAL